jgi:hypothetical protein
MKARVASVLEEAGMGGRQECVRPLISMNGQEKCGSGSGLDGGCSGFSCSLGLEAEERIS